MAQVQPDEQFIRDLTGYQHRLYAMILSFLPDPNAASDVLQETNVVLWRKATEFTPGTNFGAWAAKVAQLQVMAYRTTCGRDRLVFDDNLISSLASEVGMDGAAADEQTTALEACLEKLPVADRELLRARYAQGNTVKELSATIGKSAGALRVSLFRLRHALLECIERRLAIEPSRE